MTRDSVNKLDRRAVLKSSAGLVGASLLAGCSGGDGGDGGSSDPDGDGEDGSDGGSDSTDESEFPSRDVEVIIPFGPGGGYDFYGRLIAKHIPKHLPNDVSAQATNVEGAGGQIAMDQLWTTEPDGHTMSMFNLPNFSLTQLTEDVDWDLREFTFFGQVAEEFRGIAVGANTDIHSFEDYVERAQSEELSFASTGPGSGYVTVPGTLGEVSGLYPGASVMDNQIVYDGRGEALQGIVRGDAQVMSGSYFSLLPYVQSDDLRMVMACTTEDQPPEQTPDADTMATAEVDNATQIEDMLTDRRTFGGPPDMPDDVTEICRDAYEATLNDEELLEEAEEADRPIVHRDAEATQATTENFIESWGEREELLETLFGVEL